MAKAPLNKKALTIYFDSDVGIQNFIAWYLDGGGEQESKYYSKAWGDNWIHVAVDERACPECEYDYDGPIVSTPKHKKYINIICDNCQHPYKAPNIMYERPKKKK